MTTSWSEAWRNNQEWEDPDPTMDTLLHCNALLEAIARKDRIDEMDIERKMGPGGRDDLDGYTWSAKCFRYDDFCKKWNEVFRVRGTFEEVQTALEAKFGKLEEDEMP